MSTVNLATIQSNTALPPTIQNSSAVEIGTFCRAWVRFNSSTGANVINASFNVSSVTYNSTGNYTVNFTNSFPDANYSITYNASDSSAAPLPRLSGTPTTSACTLILTNFSNSTAINSTVNCVSVFR